MKKASAFSCCLALTARKCRSPFDYIQKIFYKFVSVARRYQTPTRTHKSIVNILLLSKNIIGHDSFAEKFEQQHENNTTTTTWHPLDCHCTPLGRLGALKGTSPDSKNFVSQRGERSTAYPQCRMMKNIFTFEITGNNTALCCKNITTTVMV